MCVCFLLIASKSAYLGCVDFYYTLVFFLKTTPAALPRIRHAPNLVSSRPADSPVATEVLGSVPNARFLFIPGIWYSVSLITYFLQFSKICPLKVSDSGSFPGRVVVYLFC